MVQTRSQDRAVRARTHSPEPLSGSKRKASGSKHGDDDGPPKQRRKSEADGKHVQPVSRPVKNFKPLLQRVLSEYGEPPLKDIVNEDWPANNIVMTHILNALLKSAPISHDVAGSTLKCLVKHNYHDLETLKKSSREERTEVLSEGGYVRYRERMSNFLGDLAGLMESKYDGNASELLPKAERGDEARSTLAKRLHEIKGIGPLGIDIVLCSIQHYFPAVAPFLDGRCRKTAHEIGLGDDLKAMYSALGSDPARMAQLEAGLTKIRLEKKEAEFRKGR